MKPVKRGYGMDECPPVHQLVPFAMQHALLMAFQSLPYPLLVSAGLGFGPGDTAVLVACSFFVAGVSSIVQTLGVGPVGGKVPIAMVCSIVFVSPALLIAPEMGFGGFMGACLAGTLLCCGVFFLFADRLKVIFPTFVSGAVVLVLGATLTCVAVQYCAGGSGAEDFGDPSNYVYSGATFLVILALTVFGKGFLRGTAPLIGLAVGFAIAACAGDVDFSSVEQAAWLGLPEPLHWGLSFPIEACIIMTVIAICGVVEILGTTSATMSVAENRIATVKETRDTVVAQAVTSVFAGFFNVVPSISSSANIGLMGVTRVYSRFAVTAAGAILLLMGLCPKLSTLFSVIPNPVFGGAVLMMFGVILVSGVKIIIGCRPDARTQTILAVSLAVGLGFNAVPQALDMFPLAASMLLCGVPGTALSAVALNLLLPGRPKGAGSGRDGRERAAGEESASGFEG